MGKSRQSTMPVGSAGIRRFKVDLKTPEERGAKIDENALRLDFGNIYVRVHSMREREKL